MIRLFSTANPLFPNNLKILLALAEADAAYEFVPIDFSKGEHRSPEFIAINAHGKTPAMTDGDVKIAESNAILWYVAEKFPAAHLLPEDAAGRARALQYCDFSAFYLYTNTYDLANHTISWEPARRSADIAERARTGLERAIDVLERVLSDAAYVAGDFSIADLACAACVRYIGERLPQYATLGNMTGKWMERITSRNSWHRVTAQGAPKR